MKGTLRKNFSKNVLTLPNAALLGRSDGMLCTERGGAAVLRSLKLTKNGTFEGQNVSNT